MSTKTVERRWECPGGDVIIERHAANVIVVRMRGTCDSNLGVEMAATLRQLVSGSSKPLHLFWDLENLSNYSPTVRTECTRVMRDERGKLASIHALIRSVIVRMGVSVANIVLGGIMQSYGERSRFDEVLRQACERGG